MVAVIVRAPLRVRLLQALSLLHAGLILVQAVAAIAFVSGSPHGFESHRSNAWAVLASGLLLAGVATASWAILGRFFVLLALSAPFLEAMQIWVGRQAQTGVHLTLAMLIWCVALALVIRAWRPDVVDAALQ